MVVKKTVPKKEKKKVENLPAIVEPKEITKEVVTEAIIKNYMNSFGIASGLNANEQMQFIEIAKAYQLNPFKREIYCVPYMASAKDEKGNWIKQKKLSIITGYEVYLKRAERTNKLNGWNCIVEGEGETLKAVITIYRKDWQHPFKHEVYWKEAAQLDDKGNPRAMWAKMGKFMLKKVCLAQGFRLCFPDEFGGMPYTADELPENMSKIEIKDLPLEPEQMEIIPEPEKELVVKYPDIDIDELYKKATNFIESSQTVKQLTARGTEFLNINKIMPADKRKILSADYNRRMTELMAKEAK